MSIESVAERKIRKRQEQYVPRANLSRGELVELVGARWKSGFGMKRFSRLIGITYKSLNNYETGKRRPPLSVLEAWRGALNLDSGDHSRCQDIT